MVCRFNMDTVVDNKELEDIKTDEVLETFVLINSVIFRKPEEFQVKQEDNLVFPIYFYDLLVNHNGSYSSGRQGTK